MAQGTLFPSPWFLALDGNGKPISGAKCNFYIAGTTTPQNTYSDVGLLVPNANPVLADGAGRVGPVYLTPGASYKLIYQDASGTLIRTQDNILAVPTSSSNQDVTGTAGQALTAAQAVYLSDGSGALNAGQWYPADSANTYSSVFPVVGVTTAAIASAAAGTIRLAGTVTGFSSLVVGSNYFVGTAGAIVSAAPTNSRLVGRADTTSSLILGSNPATSISNVIPAPNATDGQLLIGKTADHSLNLATLTAGAGMNVTNAGAAITLAASNLVLLKANSGTDTSAVANTVDTYATASALTVKDTLMVMVEIEAGSGGSGRLDLVSTTDANGVMVAITAALTVNAGNSVIGPSFIGTRQSATTAISGIAVTYQTGSGSHFNAGNFTATTAWTGAWTLGLRHNGIFGGGTLTWRWSIYKLAGQ